MFILVAAAVLLAESIALMLLMQPGHMVEACLLHVWVTVLLLGWAYSRQAAQAHPLRVLLMVLTAATGPFGAAVALAAYVVRAYYAGRTPGPVQWIEDCLQEGQDTDAQQIYERIAFGLDSQAGKSAVEPFKDILSGGTVLQKQLAIARIVRYFRPPFTPLLLEAVQDDNAAVRVQAATALAKIEHDFMGKYLRMKAALKHSPASNPAWLTLAKLCDDYAQAGLLDEENRAYFAQAAIAIYEEQLARNEDPDIRQRLARLYLRLNHLAKTCELLASAVEAGAEGTACADYMEALFRLKKLKQLRRVAARHAAGLKKTGQVELWQAWTGGAAHAA